MSAMTSSPTSGQTVRIRDRLRVRSNRHRDAWVRNIMCFARKFKTFEICYSFVDSADRGRFRERCRLSVITNRWCDNTQTRNRIQLTSIIKWTGASRPSRLVVTFWRYFRFWNDARVRFFGTKKKQKKWTSNEAEWRGSGERRTRGEGAVFDVVKIKNWHVPILPLVPCPLPWIIVIIYNRYECVSNFFTLLLLRNKWPENGRFPCAQMIS